jgi:hypothetical protein
MTFYHYIDLLNTDIKNAKASFVPFDPIFSCESYDYEKKK